MQMGSKMDGGNKASMAIKTFPTHLYDTKKRAHLSTHTHAKKMSYKMLQVYTMFIYFQ